MEFMICNMVKSNNRKRVMVTLSEKVLSELDKICKETGETYSEFLVRAVYTEAAGRN